MPHNPRRQRGPDGPDPTLTGQQIADAMERAVALRRKTAVDPGDVRAIPLNVFEAARSTRHRRNPGSQDRPAPRDPWFLVGWVTLEREWDVPDARGWTGYQQSWEVWLNGDDDQMRLKLSRLGRRAKDDPYP